MTKLPGYGTADTTPTRRRFERLDDNKNAMRPTSTGAPADDN